MSKLCPLDKHQAGHLDNLWVYKSAAHQFQHILSLVDQFTACSQFGIPPWFSHPLRRAMMAWHGLMKCMQKLSLFFSWLLSHFFWVFELRLVLFLLPLEPVALVLLLFRREFDLTVIFLAIFSTEIKSTVNNWKRYTKKKKKILQHCTSCFKLF